MKEKDKDLIVVINGSRQFTNYNLLEEKCYEILAPYIEKGFNIIIREGSARGADTLAIRFAKENNFELQDYKADWDRFGRGAGFKRNIEMIEGVNGDKKANILISFNMNTPGTNHTIRYAMNQALWVSVYEIKLY